VKNIWRLVIQAKQFETFNRIGVDLSGITEHGLRRPIFADLLQAGLVERPSIPKQERDGLRRSFSFSKSRL
jgi:hypothetical protein